MNKKTETIKNEIALNSPEAYQIALENMTCPITGRPFHGLFLIDDQIIPMFGTPTTLYTMATWDGSKDDMNVVSRVLCEECGIINDEAQDFHILPHDDALALYEEIDTLKEQLAEKEKLVKAMATAASKSISKSHDDNMCRMCGYLNGTHSPDCPVAVVVDIPLMVVDFKHHGEQYVAKSKEQNNAIKV